ncbi:hypothetical protein BH11ACT4_BH11ACT4_01000 [soil metagenome]
MKHAETPTARTIATTGTVFGAPVRATRFVAQA